MVATENSLSSHQYGPRRAVDARATVQSGSHRVKARLTDLGIGGLTLETESGVELDRFLRIRVRLSPEEPPLDLDAIVRRREGRGTVLVWEVELAEPSPWVLSRVEEHLARGDAAATPPASDPAAEAAVMDGSPPKATPDQELAGLFESALAALDL